jgi:hypothetical protein
MARKLLFLVLTLAACSKGPQADLPSISQARSLAAEWALVNQLASAGKLTPTYVETMHESIREQLQTVAKSLTQPDSGYGKEIAALTKEKDDSSPGALRAHASKLKQIEDSLESA